MARLLNILLVAQNVRRNEIFSSLAISTPSLRKMYFGKTINITRPSKKTPIRYRVCDIGLGVRYRVNDIGLGQSLIMHICKTPVF